MAIKYIEIVRIINQPDNILLTSKKHRQFDLQNRLGDYSYLKNGNDNRIKIDRLPRKKVKSIWIYVVSFMLILYFFSYLTNN